jgi:hypothetical protein
MKATERSGACTRTAKPEPNSRASGATHAEASGERGALLEGEVGKGKPPVAPPGKLEVFYAND